MEVDRQSNNDLRCALERVDELTPEQIATTKRYLLEMLCPEMRETLSVAPGSTA